MRGLILKDLLFIKNNLKSLIVFVICMILIMFNSKGDTISTLFFIPFFFMMLCISTFSYDEYNKWNTYAITLPGGRKTIVRSKYATTFLVMIIGLIASILMLILITNINSNASFEDGLNTLLGSIIGMIVAVSIIYPLMYKFGSEKGRIILFVLVVLISMLSGFIFNNINLTELVLFLNKYGKFLIPVICIIFIYISYRISLMIYNKKEF